MCSPLHQTIHQPPPKSFSLTISNFYLIKIFFYIFKTRNTQHFTYFSVLCKRYEWNWRKFIILWDFGEWKFSFDFSCHHLVLWFIICLMNLCWCIGMIWSVAASKQLYHMRHVVSHAQQTHRQRQANGYWAAEVPLAMANYAKYKQKSFVFVHKHDVVLYLEFEKVFDARGRPIDSTLLAGW